MKQNLTELVFILDKSGSMSGLESDTIGGYNSLIDKQKNEAGEALVSTILFNDTLNVVCNREDLSTIKHLTNKDYIASGCTALLDAVGSTILQIKNVHERLDEKEVPSKTLFIITTDGLENSSKEFSCKKVKELIEQQKEEGWEFIFLGANIDSVKEATKFGIDSNMSVNYCCDAKGINLNYEALEFAISSIRESGKVDETWRSKIDNDYKKRNNGK